jgi:hypothetical protein
VGRSGQAALSRLPARPALLGAAAALLAVSAGLPWSTVPATTVTRTITVTGSAHPMRLIGPIALLVLAWAIRHACARAGWAAIGIAVLALPAGLHLGHPGAGRACYLLAIVLAAAGAGLVRPRVTGQGQPAGGR